VSAILWRKPLFLTLTIFVSAASTSTVGDDVDSKENLRSVLAKVTGELDALKNAWDDERKQLQSRTKQLSAEKVAEARRLQEVAKERQTAVDAVRNLQDEAHQQRSMLQLVC
jgi:hypothetical protein